MINILSKSMSKNNEITKNSPLFIPTFTMCHFAFLLQNQDLCRNQGSLTHHWQKVRGEKFISVTLDCAHLTIAHFSSVIQHSVQRCQVSVWLSAAFRYCRQSSLPRTCLQSASCGDNEQQASFLELFRRCLFWSWFFVDNM